MYRTMIRRSLLRAALPLLLAGMSACSTGSEVEKEVLREGDGEAVEAGDYITAHYTLSLRDGTVIESSRPDQGGDGPFRTTIGAGFVIEGWDRGIPGMRVGELARLTIPPELAYGEEGRPQGGIPENAELIFEVEVLEARGGPKVEMPQGLSYEVLEEGEGEVVQRGDSITAHYTLYLPDGTMLQSSREEQGGTGPFETVVGVGQVIPGWDRMIPGMRVGEVRRLHVPSDFAYGEQGRGEAIPPNTDLTFEVEVLDTEHGASRR
ncbi:MAG: FKBP-type peptidyl-prolyl cis-trans isomerase [bacterium]